MSKDFTGEAGTIYIQKADSASSHPYEVWFEDFCILGEGDSELEALQAAAARAADLAQLIASAIESISTVSASGD